LSFAEQQHEVMFSWCPEEDLTLKYSLYYMRVSRALLIKTIPVLSLSHQNYP
jgi:hypothetical protein